MAVSVFKMAADKKNIPVTVEAILKKIKRAGAKARVAILSAAVETLENIVSYSGAEEVTLELNNSAEKITLTIIDNGIPFDPSSVGDNKDKGLGLIIARNMADNYSYRYENGSNVSVYEKYL